MEYVEHETKLENMIHMLFIYNICIECARVSKVEATISLTCTSLSVQWQHLLQFFTMYPHHQMNIQGL
jgi:hypothetical protein